LFDPYQLLRMNRLLRSHRIKCLGVLAADKLRLRHLSMRFDPFVGCNLRCQMCYFSTAEFQSRKAEILSLQDYTKIAKLMFGKAIQVVLGTGAEPTVHPNLVQMVEIAKVQYKVPFVSISTNAQLLTMEMAQGLLQAGLDEITISMHGVRKETYERLQPPAVFEKLHRAFEVLTKLSQERTRPFRVRVNFTVNPDNHGELGEFFEVFGKYKIDILQVRKIFDLGDAAYTKRDLSPMAESLEKTVSSLALECRRRKMTFLRPSFGSAEEDSNPLATILLPLVHRHVTPSKVWKQDFDWRNETYDAYLNRVGWHRELWRMAFRSPERVASEIQEKDRSLGYNVS
jgi:molybdenum cofactor biosynthesis enzyme MoaA